MSQKFSARDIAKATLTLVVHDSPKRVARALAAYLISESRTKDTNAVIRELLQLRKEQGLVEAEAISVHKLTTALRDEITATLAKEYAKNTKVLLDESTDPSLIGGVKVSAPDVELDISIKHRLQLLNASTQVN